MRGKTIIIQGGQYGSEGKGQIAAVVAGLEGVTCAVRTGSINAGHTVYHKGEKFSMQIIPTAWVHPEITLILGAGCYIEPAILQKEIDMINKAMPESDVRDRLFIDNHCVWFGDNERMKSQIANRHHAMGATGKGCSEAIIAKMQDRGDADLAENRLFISHTRHVMNFADTIGYLNRVLESGRHVLLEGTQGSLLDFNTGPYPYVTSRMTSSAAWLAEAGLPPINVHTILVVRSHPIRVAGNSGPLPQEITWPMLAREINAKLAGAAHRSWKDAVPETALVIFEQTLLNVMITEFPEVVEDVGEVAALQPHLWSVEQRVKYRVALSEAHTITLKRLDPQTLEDLKFFEKTTVTKKLRRVARLDVQDVLRAIEMNGPTKIAYTFLNYDIPQLNNETDMTTVAMTARDRLSDLEAAFHVPIDYVTTGPLNEHVINLSQ